MEDICGDDGSVVRGVVDDDIVGDGCAAQPRKRKHAVTVAGPLVLFFVIAGASAWPKVRCVLADESSWGDTRLPESCSDDADYFVGVIRGSWALYSTAVSENKHGVWFARAADALSHSGTGVRGYVLYTVDCCVALSRPFRLNGPLGPSELLAAAQDHELVGVSGTLSDWKDKHGGYLVDTVVALRKSLAVAAVNGHTSFFYAVAVTARTRRNSLLHVPPSRRILRRWLLSLGAAAAGKHPRVEERPASSWENAVPAQKVIDWLRATKFLKDTKLTKEAAAAWATVLCNSGIMDSSALVASCTFASREIIRLARVRADLVAMLMFRKMFKMLDYSCTHLYLFADGSPLFRGEEMFAATFDMLCEGVLQRRLFPPLRLPREYWGAVSKAYALVWMIFLMVGPSFHAVRCFCNRVRGITTDNGTERMLADTKDVLVSFYTALGTRMTPDMTSQQLLFPRAMSGLGWRHVWDSVLRAVLFKLPGFPLFFSRFKNLVQFMRDASILETLLKSFRSNGLNALADLIANTSLPNFAKWRWSTMEYCCDALNVYLRSLAKHFQAALFGNIKEEERRSMLIAVTEALSAPRFLMEFKFVRFLCSWLGKILRFGGACPCHQDEYELGIEVKCDMVGRVLTLAHKYATDQLQAGLAIATSWPDGFFDGDVAFMQSAVGCCRHAVHLGAMKIAPLDEVPYLIGSLNEPGVKARVEEQFDAVPEASHGECTLDILSPSRSLRADFDLVQNDGTGMTEKLSAEVLCDLGILYLHSASHVPA